MKLISIASLVALFAAFVVAVPVVVTEPEGSVPLGYKRSEEEIEKRTIEPLKYCPTS